MATDTDTVELVRRGYAAALAGDLDVLREILHPDVLWHGGNPDDGCRGRDQTLAFMAQAVRRRGPTTVRLVDVIAEGDTAVVVMAPDGDATELVANLTRIRDGQVIEMIHYPSPEEALAAAGISDARR